MSLPYFSIHPSFPSYPFTSPSREGSEELVRRGGMDPLSSFIHGFRSNNGEPLAFEISMRKTRLLRPFSL